MYIIIEVRGGIVQEIKSDNDHIQCDVVDYDHDPDGEELKKRDVLEVMAENMKYSIL